MRRILLLALCAWFPAASARPINEDVEMFRRDSDVIVIGHVLAVKEMTDEATLPGLTPPIPVLGVDTTFHAESVLKGELTNTVFVVHHYRLRNASTIYNNGPLLMKFNRANRFRQYLMFLKRGTDGRYVPAGGQADAGLSFRALLHPGEGLKQAVSEKFPDKEELKRQAEQIQETPNTPLLLRFVRMETPYGVRRAPKVRATNSSNKAIIWFNTQIVFFDEHGEVLDITGLTMGAAVGESVVPARGERDVVLDGGNENYETASARAVVTSVKFDDGTTWQPSKESTP